MSENNAKLEFHVKATIICPKCGSDKVTRERRPDGNDICQVCHHSWHSKDSSDNATKYREFPQVGWNIELSTMAEQILESAKSATKVVGWYAHYDSVRGPYCRWFNVTEVHESDKSKVAYAGDDTKYAANCMNYGPYLAEGVQNLQKQLEEEKTKVKNLTVHKVLDKLIATPDEILKRDVEIHSLTKQLDEAKAEIERLFAIKLDEQTKDEFYKLARKLEEENGDLRDKVYLLEAETTRLRTLVEFYADEDNFSVNDMGVNERDQEDFQILEYRNCQENEHGDYAREALKKEGGK